MFLVLLSFNYLGCFPFALIIASVSAGVLVVCAVVCVWEFCTYCAGSLFVLVAGFAVRAFAYFYGFNHVIRLGWSSTISVGFPSCLACWIVHSVPREWPSQKAITASASWAISWFRSKYLWGK